VVRTLTVRRLPRARPDDRGVVSVVVALVVVFVVMPLLAIVVDLGLARVASGQARSAADAAALAAAVSHPDLGNAVAAAHQIADDDFGITEEQWAACVDPQALPVAPAPGNCVSFDPTAKQVRVTLPAKQVPSVFSGILGSRPPAASATSVATWGAFSQLCALCVFGSYQGGAQQLEVRGGDVAVGGDLTIGSGGALLTDVGEVVSVAGTATVTGTMSTAPTHADLAFDPFATQLAALAALPDAAPSAVAKPWPDHIECNAPTYQDTSPCSAPCSPGTYQDVSMCTSFAPGVYVLTGVPAVDRLPITLHAGGDGVVFYVTCNSGSWPFSVHPAPCSQGTSLQPKIGFAAGTGTLTLRGNTAYGGLALAFDPTTPSGSNTNQRFGGTGTLTVNGSIDGPGVTLCDPLTPNDGRLLIDGGRLVVGSVAYNAPPPVPPHPYVTVQAPPLDPLPDGPVRLVTPSS
jgi:Putative Flp pilus-assembly TadE/G-like